MHEVSQISEFGKILIFLIVGFLAVGLTFFLNKVLSRSNPTPDKLMSYECGEEPVGSAWLPFNTRFYVIALVFLLFEVEMVFVFPWATVFGNHEIIAADKRWGWFALVEMFAFLGILILGLVYAWRKGDLNWIKPEVIKPVTDSPVPASLYERINLEQSAYQTIPFSMESAVNSAPVAETAAPASAPVRKPMFKPTFKKPENDS